MPKSIEAIDKHISSNDLGAFQTLIKQQGFNLESEYLIDDQPLTLLEYLILNHDSDNWDLLSFINALVRAGASLRNHQPTHLALQLGKADIALLLLLAYAPSVEGDKGSQLDSSLLKKIAALGKQGQHALNLQQARTKGLTIRPDERDQYGQTLGDIIVSSKNEMVLHAFADHHGLNPNARVYYDDLKFMPLLHWAIAVDNAPALSRMLTPSTIDMPFTNELNSPFLHVIASGSPSLLKIIIEHDAFKDHSLVQSKENDASCAMKLLIDQLDQSSTRYAAIEKIGILLAAGMNVKDSQIESLRPYHQEIAKAAKAYLNTQPQHAKRFMSQCHKKDSPLHQLFYAQDTWWQVLMTLFGWQDHTAFELEAISQITIDIHPAQTTNSEPVPPCSFNPKEQQFAQFCQAFNQRFSQSWFFNPMNSMRRKLATGEITNIDEVTQQLSTCPDALASEVLTQTLTPQK